MERENLTQESWLEKGYLPEKLQPSGKLFQELWALRPEEHAAVKIYGKLTPIPRWHQSYLQDYSFSGQEAKAKELPLQFQPFLQWANDLPCATGKSFDQVLVNWYQDGNHYIGSHADDERQLVPQSPIVTLTFCQPAAGEKKAQPRVFRIRDRKSRIIRDVPTDNGLVLIMGGRFQQQFKHEIVKVTGKRASKMGPRISITLRQFIKK
jgi:alkylated DNA repair dioxygenase AlkB